MGCFLCHARRPIFPCILCQYDPTLLAVHVWIDSRNFQDVVDTSYISSSAHDGVCAQLFLWGIHSVHQVPSPEFY